jgi:hypothetical protein
MEDSSSIIKSLGATPLEAFIKLLNNQICFDAKAEGDFRCEHHGGKCYELGLLIDQIRTVIKIQTLEMPDKDFYDELQKRNFVPATEETIQAVWQDGVDSMRKKVLELVESKRKNYSSIGFFDRADGMETLTHLVKEIKL